MDPIPTTFPFRSATVLTAGFPEYRAKETTLSAPARILIFAPFSMAGGSWLKPLQMQIFAQARSVGREAVGVDAFRHAVDRHADARRQMFRRPAVADERVGLLEVAAVAPVRLARHVDHDRCFVHSQPRRLIQRVRVDDVRLLRACRDPAPGRAAEPLFVGVQERGRQAAATTCLL